MVLRIIQAGIFLGIMLADIYFEWSKQAGASPLAIGVVALGTAFVVTVPLSWWLAERKEKRLRDKLLADNDLLPCPQRSRFPRNKLP